MITLTPEQITAIRDHLLDPALPQHTGQRMTTLTAEQITAVRDHLLDPSLHIGIGKGVSATEHCTVAAIHFALTGKLADGPHPCMSEVVRRWVIRIQDVMPDKIRNSAKWRQAAVGIAGSAGSEVDEQARMALLLGWMWERLSDEAVVAAVPEVARVAWDRMLRERTARAACAAYAADDATTAAASDAAAAAAAAVYDATTAAYDDAAYDVAVAAAAAAYAAAYAATAAAYWERADLPGTLTQLINTRDNA